MGKNHTDAYHQHVNGASSSMYRINLCLEVANNVEQPRRIMARRAADFKTLVNDVKLSLIAREDFFLLGKDGSMENIKDLFHQAVSKIERVWR